MRTGWMKTAVIYFLLGGSLAWAQTTVTTGGGTTYRIPKFSGNYTLVDSVLSESNGDLLVGGTTGIQFSSAYQLIGTIGGNQSSFSMQANSIYDTSATGGLFFMGGSQRGDGLKSQALILGNSTNYYPVPGTQTGVLVDGSSGVNMVGIGMASGSHPGAQLEVNGGIKLSQFGGGSIMFPDGSVQSTAAWSSANGTLNIGGSTGGWQTPALINIGGSNDVGMAFGTANYGTLMGSVEGNWFNILNPFVIQPGGRSPADHPIVLTTVQNSPTNGLVIQNSGNIGIGTISPNSRLEVNGGIQLTAGSNGKIIFPDGSSLASANGLSTGSGGSGGGYSSITQTGSSIGIGTATPNALLDVAGVINGRNYGFPANNGNPSWAKIGTFTGGPGDTIRITAFIHRGYNASNSMDSTYYINFKTSNNHSSGSVDGNGFAGNGSYYAIGYNSDIPPGSIKWVSDQPGIAANQFSLFIYLPVYAEGSHYAVTVDQNASWTHSGTLVSSDPGPVANASVMIPPAEFDLPYGNVGIGVAGSPYKLEVAGNMKLSGSNGSLTFPDGSIQTSASTVSAGSGATIGGSSVTQNTGGKSVYLWGGGSDGTNYTGASVGGAIAFNGSNYIVGTDGGSNGGWMFRSTGGGDNIGLYTIPSTGGNTQTINSANIESFRRMTVTSDGSIGIGTGAPGAKLEVNGNVKVDGTITFPNGTVQTEAWHGVLTGGDYAESVDVVGDRKTYEAGDVLTIDAALEGRFLKSSVPYSTFVTGIYSTKPGVVGRRQKTAEDHMPEEVPMAMTGIVPTKVSAENGPIKPGDLLVTSSIPGYAMKGTDRKQMLGAVIGKALGHLDKGTGVIEVVVSLQ